MRSTASIIAISLLLTTAIPESAEATRLGRACRDGFDAISVLARTARIAARDSWRQFRREVDEQGRVRWVLRNRSEEELAERYRDYWIRNINEEVPRTSWAGRGWNRLLRIGTYRNRSGQRRRVTPFRGLFGTIDRAIFGTRTMAGAPKFLTTLAAGATATYFLYERPLSNFERETEMENFREYALDYDYSFRGIRDAMKAGEMDRGEALKIVEGEIAARSRYFEDIKQLLTDNPTASVEDISIAFIQNMNDPTYGSVFNDLRYFTSEAFRNNPVFMPKGGKWEKVTKSQYQELFALNDFKINAFAMIADWSSKDFAADAYEDNERKKAMVEVIRQDPFFKELLDYHKQNPERFPHEALESMIMEDIEWKVRFGQLDALGVLLIVGQNEEGILQAANLEDRRAEFRERIGMPTPKD